MDRMLNAIPLAMIPSALASRALLEIHILDVYPYSIVVLIHSAKLVLLVIMVFVSVSSVLAALKN